ncbi:hypothetical protein DIPPA_05655 [Diplonema papillatum]|nr:hypothetical protein DIPPA_05655 [Diplonema papillatum]
MPKNEQPTVELHVSPPGYGLAAISPHCLAVIKLFELSGIKPEVHHEMSNNHVLPSIVVFGETTSGPMLTECEGATPAEALACIIQHVADCGAHSGPVRETAGLSPKNRAQSAAFYQLLESSLVPSLRYIRWNSHRDIHKAELSKHVSLLQRVVRRSAYSFSRRERLAKSQTKFVVRSEKDALELAKEGYTAVATLLASSSTRWLQSTKEPTLLDVLAWSLLSCHYAMPKLKAEIANYPQVLAYTQSFPAEPATRACQLRPLSSIDAPDPYAQGRLTAAVVMAAIFSCYAYMNCDFPTLVITYLRRIAKQLQRFVVLDIRNALNGPYIKFVSGRKE